MNLMLKTGKSFSYDISLHTSLLHCRLIWLERSQLGLLPDPPKDIQICKVSSTELKH